MSSTKRKEEFGIRYNLNKKRGDVASRWEWLEKYVGRTYEINSLRMIYFIAFALLGGFAVIYYMMSNPTRALYLGIPIFILYLTACACLLFMTMTDASYGSLFSKARTISRFKKREKAIKNGKEEPVRETGDGQVDADGYIWEKDGRVARVGRIEGFVSPLSFKKDVNSLLDISTAWQRERLRGVLELPISTVEPQSAKHQIRENNKRIRQAKRSSTKEMCKLQNMPLEAQVEGSMLTIVQYNYISAPNKKLLDDYLGLYYDYCRRGLVYSVQMLDQQEARELLRNIRYLQ